MKMERLVLQKIILQGLKQHNLHMTKLVSQKTILQDLKQQSLRMTRLVLKQKHYRGMSHHKKY